MLDKFKTFFQVFFFATFVCMGLFAIIAIGSLLVNLAASHSFLLAFPALALYLMLIVGTVCGLESIFYKK